MNMKKNTVLNGCIFINRYFFCQLNEHFIVRGTHGVGDLSYLPCAISSSMASSTLALKESSLASSSNSWAGDSSSNMPVILLAKA